MGRSESEVSGLRMNGGRTQFCLSVVTHTPEVASGIVRINKVSSGWGKSFGFIYMAIQHTPDCLSSYHFAQWKNDILPQVCLQTTW